MEDPVHGRILHSEVFGNLGGGRRPVADEGEVRPGLLPGEAEHLEGRERVLLAHRATEQAVRHKAWQCYQPCNDNTPDALPSRLFLQTPARTDTRERAATGGCGGHS